MQKLILGEFYIKLQQLQVKIEIDQVKLRSKIDLFPKINISWMTIELTSSMNNYKGACKANIMLSEIICRTCNVGFSRLLAPIHSNSLLRRRATNHSFPQMWRNCRQILFMYRLQFIFASNSRTSWIAWKLSIWCTLL